MPRARVALPSILVLALALQSTELYAQSPWTSELTPEREQKLLEEARAQEQLDGSDRLLLDFAVKSGMLLATAICESSGTVESTYSGIDKHWVGTVKNSASVTVSNLSDETVWLIEVTIAPKTTSREELGTWTANLPFIPPHSQALMMMPCNTLTASEGDSYDTLDSNGTPGPMTKALARKLALTPSLFDQRDSNRSITYQVNRPRSPSLAMYALPHVADRETARLLAEAIQENDDQFKELVSDRISGVGHSLGGALGQAPLEAAHGIVDAVEDASPDELAELLAVASGTRSGANDEALLRLVTNVCTRGEPATLARVVAKHFEHEAPDDWVLRVVAACPLAPAQTSTVIEELAKTPGMRIADPPAGLIRFIKLAPSPSFEIGLSIMLGVDPARFTELELEPGAVPEVIDGGERAEVLWYAMATLPPPERLAVLESLVRPEDVSEILVMLIPWKMNPERLALFERIAARIDELPAERRGAALEPVFRAALRSAYLERSLLDRLFGLVEHDPQRLRPLAIEALDENQSMFTGEALAALPHGLSELLDQIAGPLHDCSARGRLNDCFALYEADPALWAAVESGLKPEFRNNLIASLSWPDPSDEQREVLPKYLRLGIDIDPIAMTTCERAKQLVQFGGDASEHVAFLQEFAPDHPCTQELQRQLGYGMRIWTIGIGSGLGVLALIGLLFLRARRRQRQLLDEVG